MNIFEILASGDNGLREVHVSSVLGWFLDPYHDHGLGIEVLKRLVSNLFDGTPLHKEIAGSEYSGVEMKTRRRIETSILLEKDVYCKDNNKNRSIDIVATINNKFILAVENKIRSDSKEHGQAEDEMRGLIDAPEYAGKEIYFIYLVKQADELAYASAELKNAGQIKITANALSWIGNNKNDLSMNRILQDIIADHTQGNINPIPAETLFLLRSFIRFAENGFSYYLGQGYKRQERYLFKDLANVEKPCFVGFQGGLKALDNSLKDTTERNRLLFERPYKILRNAPNDNWILIDEFLECFKKNGISYP